MNKKILSLICFTLLGVFSSSAVMAQMKYETKIPGDYFIIKSARAGDKNSGQGFLKQPGQSKGQKFKSGDKIIFGKMGGDDDQLYQFKPLADGWYFITSRNGGYLDVTGGKDADGVRMQVYASNSSASQMFHLVHQGGGRFKIYTVWGRILSTVGDGRIDGTEVNTVADYNSPTAEWYFYNISTGKKYVPEDAAVISENKPAANDGKNMMIESLSYGGNYFSDAATMENFNQYNAKGELVSHLNQKYNGADQWPLIKGIIEQVVPGADVNLRRAVFKSLAEVSVVKGSGFADTMVKSTLLKQIQNSAIDEKDAEAKGYLNTVIKKFK